MNPLDPGRLWWWSTRLHRRGLRVPARLLKALNFILFKAVLPPDCVLDGPVLLFHRAVGVVIHPAVSFGTGVHIGHGVTVTTSDWQATEVRVRIEDRVTIGMGAVVNGKRGEVTTIGSNAKIGANAVVVESIPAGATVFPPLGEIRLR